jgi:CheY-like chemotaxis protein
MKDPVLLFGGDADAAEMYSIGLSLAGFQPVLAPDAQTALACIRRTQPRVIVATLDDSRDAGWQVLHDIRDNPEIPDTPVVLITGGMDAAIRARAQELGCSALLLKPCLPDALAVVLRCALSATGAPRIGRAAVN